MLCDIYGADAHKLGEAIAETGQRMGIYNGQVALGGPQLLMLLKDIETLALPSAVLEPIAQLSEPQPLSFSDKDEQELWAAFETDPRKSLGMAITGLRRMYLQGLSQKGKTMTMPPPPSLSKEVVIELRKETRAALEPWGETLAFAAKVQGEVNTAWQQQLLGTPSDA